MPAVVVTGSIAEMIGGGVTPEGSNLLRFIPRTIDEDQWQGADRAIYWLWTEFGPRKAGSETQAARRGRQAARQHHRADLRHLQHAVRPRGDPPAGRGHRLRDQSGLPARLAYRGHRAAAGCRREHLHVSRVRPPAVRGTGPAVPAGADRPARTTNFLRTLGELTGVDPEPFIEREKHTTIKPIWDLWRSVTQDFFATATFAIVATDTYARGVRQFLEDEMGIPCTFAVSRCAGVKPDNAAVREALRAQDAAGAVRFVQRAHVRRRDSADARCTSRRRFPGAIIRRATGTPFMGYAGATYIVQEFCNALFDALFNILPLGTDLDKVEPTPARLHRELPWDEAEALLEDVEPAGVGAHSAAKRLRDRPSATRARPARPDRRRARWATLRRRKAAMSADPAPETTRQTN